MDARLLEREIRNKAMKAVSICSSNLRHGWEDELSMKFCC